MERKLKIGLIGCGGIATHAHLPSWAKIGEAEIVACCDIIESKAQAAAAKCGAKLVFTDYRELLKVAEIDAVDICTPNYLHSVIAVDAFAAGKHVLCEKPDAVSVAEAQRMVKASEDAGKLLMVIRNNRFTAGSRFLKRFIEEGRMGDIYAGRCGWIRRRGIPGRGGWFTTKAQSGGGPLIDLGVHMIDLAMYLMGNPRPVAVSGSVYNKFANVETKMDSAVSAFGEAKAGGTFDVEDLAMGYIRFENGASLQIEFSWASNIPAEKNFVELRGSKAGCAWERGAVTIFGEEQGELVDLQPRLDDSVYGHELNLRNFISAVQDGAEPVFKPRQGVDMIKILCAVYESARLGKEVSL